MSAELWAINASRTTRTNPMPGKRFNMSRRQNHIAFALIVLSAAACGDDDESSDTNAQSTDAGADVSADSGAKKPAAGRGGGGDGATSGRGGRGGAAAAAEGGKGGSGGQKSDADDDKE